MDLTTYSFVSEKACRSHRADDGREIWTVSVSVSDLPLGLKLGPNARYATLSNRPARAMLETLRNDPKAFVFRNNGIMIVADSISVEGNRVTIRCKEPGPDDDSPGHGVLNGGHTYTVLTEALRRASSGDAAFKYAPEATVVLTIATNVDEEDVWKISLARNTSEKVPLHALRELAGDWSVLKDALPESFRSRVAFKPNEPGSEDALYDVTDLVRRLALINNRMFPAESGVHPVKAYTSIGSLVKQFKKEDFLEVAPLLPDVLKLEDLIVQFWDNSRGKGEGKIAIGKATGVTRETTTLISGTSVGISLPAPFVLPVIAAFRVFIKDGRWSLPIEQLWEKYGSRTIEALWEAYKGEGKSSPAVFGRSKSSWAAACDLTKMAAIQMGLIKIE